VGYPERRYVGISADVSARLDAHNAGQNRSTAPWRPWRVDVVIEFRSERLAGRFEKYLKSGAGHAFSTHHFVDESPTT
jgi:putative endonuclease